MFRSVFFVIQSHTIPYYVHILPYYVSYYVYAVYVYVQTYIFPYCVLLCFPCSYNPTLCSHTHYASLLHCMCIVCNSTLCSSLYSFFIHYVCVYNIICDMYFHTLFHCVCVPLCVCSYYVTCIFILCSTLCSLYSHVFTVFSVFIFPYYASL